ncbi:MAG: hypothetical protein NTX56_12795, partial [Proteobacteria bacterium]|nr:hypothetical protein [Pseudomonadota bacterium]
MSKRTTIHIADRLEEAIGKNPPSLSGRLTTIGDRYLEILRRARIDKKITDAEFAIMRDATADVKFEPARLIDGALRQCLEEALRDG